MRRLLLSTMAVVLVVAAPALASLPPSTPYDDTAIKAAIKAIKSGSVPYSSSLIDGTPLLWSRGLDIGMSSPGSRGGTGRQMFQAQEAMHDPRVIFANYCIQNSFEAACNNPVTVTASIDYPDGIAGSPRGLTVNGRKTFTIQPGGWAKTDAVAISFPSGATPYVITRIQLSLAPTAISATGATTGGSLTAGTNSYVVTAVAGEQGESGPSSTATVTNTGSTSSNVLTWTLDPLSVPATAISIYRNGVLLATVPPTTTSWTDTGSLTAGTKAPPQSGQTYPFGITESLNGGTGQTTGEGDNYTTSGGTGSDQTGTSGTGWITGGYVYAYGADAMVAQPDVGGRDKPTVCIYGDSIARGTGEYLDRGYIARALIDSSPSIPFFQESVPSAGIVASVTNSGLMMKTVFSQDCSDSVVEYGTNDTYASENIGTEQVPAIKSNLLQFWAELSKRGSRVWQTTILPRTGGSTDSMATAANQLREAAPVSGATNASPIVVSSVGYIATGLTDGSPVKITGITGNTAANGSFYAKVSGYNIVTFAIYQDAGLTVPVAGNGSYAGGGNYERLNADAGRININDWLRAGAPITISGASMTPAAIGTAGAVTIGQSGHPLTGIFDAASKVEVNSSNVLTPDGGYWISNGTADYYVNDDGTHPTINGTALLMQAIDTTKFKAP